MKIVSVYLDYQKAEKKTFSSERVFSLFVLFVGLFSPAFRGLHADSGAAAGGNFTHFPLVVVPTQVFIFKKF